MRLILTEERANFDTIAAMLGTFLLHEDAVLLLPADCTPGVGALLQAYFFKLPFEDPADYQDESGGFMAERDHSRIFGFEYLQSLQVAGQLMMQSRRLDSFYASILLLGIYSTANRLDSFSVVDQATQVSSYLLEQGADEDFVKQWLDYSGDTPAQIMFPKLVRHKIEKNHSFWETIPAWHTLMETVVSQETRRLGLRLFVVGGYVRDLMIGGSSTDLDFIVEGNAVPVAKALARQYGGKLVTHQAFGTARWEFKAVLAEILKRFPEFEETQAAQLPDSLDLISARTEWYLTEAQLPVVRRSRIQLDLRRRDFTINALGMRLDDNFGTILDGCSGLKDLELGIIRALHPRSLIDDPTRNFRAVRYEQRLGFQIDEKTLDWMQASYPLLKQVSGDRLRHELNLMLAEDHPEKNFIRMAEIGLMGAFHPDWQWNDALTDPLRKAIRGSAAEWGGEDSCGHLTFSQLAAYLVLFRELPQNALETLLNRLLFSSQQKRLCAAFNAAFSKIQTMRDAKPSEWTRVFDSLAGVSLFALSVLLAEDEAFQTALREYRVKWKNTKPMLNGEDFREMGIAPGPIYGILLEQLRTAWLDGVVKDEAGERAALTQLLRNAGALE